MSYKDNVDKQLAELFDSIRDRSKPANFGLLYGMSAEGFMAYAWAAYGIKFTLEEAAAIRKAFFELYPGLLDYHERMRSIAKVREEVRTPMGRIRHLPHIKAWDRAVRAKAERQAINSPVQGCLTDMMIWAIALSVPRW
jgi:DNA polymerase I-like protein with 3'-5' exonuclease and polymerase domains